MAYPAVPLVFRRTLVADEAFRWLAHSRDWMAENYQDRITLEDAARQACLSPFHYQRLFSRAFGETPHRFLTKLRIDRAKLLLVKSGLTVSEICYEVGYESIGTFSTFFGRQVGCTPTEFRRVFSIPGAWTFQVVPACFLSMRQAGGGSESEIQQFRNQ